MKIKKLKKQERFLPLEELKKIDSEFFEELERIRRNVSCTCDEKTIRTFYDTAMDVYSDAVALRIRECAVDYEIRLAEIEERRKALKPWRRCWLWRLLFRPLTNRAQDIIEERAELDADFVHTAAEKAIRQDREKLTAESKEKLSRCELRRIKREKRKEMQDRLNAAIQAADNADTSSAFYEQPPAPADKTEQPQAQTQMQLDELAQAMPQRRPRPPRSCRKPATPAQ